MKNTVRIIISTVLISSLLLAPVSVYASEGTPPADGTGIGDTSTVGDGAGSNGTANGGVGIEEIPDSGTGSQDGTGQSSGEGGGDDALIDKTGGAENSNDNGGKAAGEGAADEAGKAAGEGAADDSGKAAGEGAADEAGKAAGEGAADDAGKAAGEGAADDAGKAAGEDAADEAGKAAGEGVADEAGKAAGEGAADDAGKAAGGDAADAEDGTDDKTGEDAEADEGDEDDLNLSTQAEKTYTVTFKDGVNGKVLKTQKVKEGKAATAPAAPAHPGYKFSKWDKAFNKIKANITVTAKYAFKNGFVDENGGKVYYQDGKKLTGQKRLSTDGGKTYYWYMFRKNGTMVKSAFYAHDKTTNPKGGAKTCYYNNNGHLVYGQKRLSTDGGKTYYWYMFRTGSGAMVKNTMFNHNKDTNPKGGAKTCYYDKSGHMVYGQMRISTDGGKTYYWYMFRTGSGAMVKNTMFNHNKDSNPKGGAKTCYYDKSGHMVYGQKRLSTDGKKYYWYMFNMQSGAMIRNAFYDHDKTTNPKGGAKTCYYDADGHMLYGKQVINGKTFYFDEKSGAMNSVRVLYPQACAVLDNVGWTLGTAYHWAATRKYVPQQDNLSTRAYADYTFTNNAGSSYGMAAAFYEMAMALGVEAHVMTGKVSLKNGGMGAHSWVEVVIEGRVYVCDPSFENDTGSNGYLIYYGQSGTWEYVDAKRVN